MKLIRKQSAASGVLSATFFNTLSFLLRYGRQAVIAALFGLSLQLDAFYMALGLLEVLIFSFAFIFDIVVVPKIVEDEQAKNQVGVDRLTSTFFLLSLFGGIIATVIIAVFSRQISYIALGFDETKREQLRIGLYLLLPIAAFFLPYRALGAFFRAKRNFRVFYLSEMLIYLFSFIFLFVKPKDPRIIFLSSSIGHTTAFCVLLILSARNFKLVGYFDKSILRSFLIATPAILLLNGITQILTFTDRLFATFLSTGSMSALSYGRLIVGVFPSLFSLQVIFLTVFAEGEKERREKILNYTVKIAIMLSIPFTIVYIISGVPIIQILFGRGNFDIKDVQTTALAVRYYSIGFIGMIIQPVCVAAFRVMNKMRSLILVTLIGICTNVVLNSLFVFVFHLEIKGIALSTSISLAMMYTYSLIKLRKLGLDFELKSIFRSLGLFSILGGVLMPLLFFIRGSEVVSLLAIFLFFILYFLCVFLLPIQDLRWASDFLKQFLRQKLRRDTLQVNQNQD